MKSSNSVCSRTPSWPCAKPFWMLLLWYLLASRKACSRFRIKDEYILYGTDCSVIGLKLSTLAVSPFLYSRMVTPTLQAFGVYWECQQFAIMLCKIVRRIEHFFSVITLI